MTTTKGGTAVNEHVDAAIMRLEAAALLAVTHPADAATMVADAHLHILEAFSCDTDAVGDALRREPATLPAVDHLDAACDALAGTYPWTTPQGMGRIVRIALSHTTHAYDLLADDAGHRRLLDLVRDGQLIQPDAHTAHLAGIVGVGGPP